jgi:serine/threonine-protein kinase
VNDPDVKEKLSRHCNWSGTGLGHTSAVGLFPKGKADCGALDLSGNVWEWCGDWYDQGRHTRVVRGGSWVGGISEDLSVSCRSDDGPDYRHLLNGFRCVVVGGVAAAG